MVRPGSPAPLWGVAGKAGYALSCVAAALVLAVSGFSYFVVRDVSSIGGSHAINSGPSIGAQNILRMGLESRTDWNGNVLPNDILNALHAGSRQGVLYEGVGGNATNTLILIHIPAGGKKAIGFSIPRDDWVTFPETYDGQHTGKIDQAYGDALAEKESEVRQQHPNAKMALAFVRQRHGLINGDLDRTHRQQAFLASVMHQLRTEGVLGDLTKINSLLSVAKQYVITDSGWNLLDFATQMRSLTSGSLSFNTLPIESYITIEGQSANQVDVPYIQQLVHNTFYPAPRPSGSPGPRAKASATVSAAEAAATTVDVYNGGRTPGLAGDV